LEKDPTVPDYEGYLFEIPSITAAMQFPSSDSFGNVAMADNFG
jgi:hypothetical protein